MKYSFIIILASLAFVSCSPGSGGKLNDTFMSIDKSTVQGITLNKGIITVDGTYLNNIDSVKIQRIGYEPVSIEMTSKTSSKLIGKVTETVSLIAGEAFNLLISTAAGDTLVSAVFNIGARSIPITALSGVLGEGGNEGDTIVWDSRVNSWRTVPSANETYLGVFNAAPNGNDVESYPKAGDFYYVGTAGSRDLNGTGAVSYSNGDKIIYNGSSWDLIRSNNGVTSFKGRVGSVIPASGDYSWSMLSKVTNSNQILGSSLGDIVGVDFTAPPVAGDLLTFEDGKWKPKAQRSLEFSNVAGELTTSRITDFSPTVRNTTITTIASFPPNTPNEDLVVVAGDSISVSISKLQSQATTGYENIEILAEILNTESQISSSNTVAIDELNEDINFRFDSVTKEKDVSFSVVDTAEVPASNKICVINTPIKLSGLSSSIVQNEYYTEPGYLPFKLSADTTPTTFNTAPVTTTNLMNNKCNGKIIYSFIVPDGYVGDLIIINNEYQQKYSFDFYKDNPLLPLEALTTNLSVSSPNLSGIYEKVKPTSPDAYTFTKSNQTNLISFLKIKRIGDIVFVDVEER